MSYASTAADESGDRRPRLDADLESDGNAVTPTYTALRARIQQSSGDGYETLGLLLEVLDYAASVEARLNAALAPTTRPDAIDECHEWMLQQFKEQASIQWEYRSYGAAWQSDSDLGDLLNEGWELVGSPSTFVFDGTTCIFAVLRRPRQEVTS
jgi:hypothetical protein